MAKIKNPVYFFTKDTEVNGRKFRKGQKWPWHPSLLERVVLSREGVLSDTKPEKRKPLPTQEPKLKQDLETEQEKKPEPAKKKSTKTNRKKR